MRLQGEKNMTNWLQVFSEMGIAGAPTPRDYLDRITKKHCDCSNWRHLGKEPIDLSNLPVQHYPHSGGWIIAGYEKRQWLYVVCPRCGYQWALSKLGVPRESSPETKSY